jgi:thymidylate synthase
MNRSLNRSDAQYHRLLLEIMANGKDKSDRTGTGTKSIFDYKIKFDMAHGFPLITTKRLHTKSIIHELLWFLKGSTNTKYLKENGVTIWDEWADKNGDLGPVYGKQWRNWREGEYTTPLGIDGPSIWKEGIDQIQNAIDTLKNNPDSRRIMVVAYNVGEIDQMALPPCHWAFELYTEELTIDERMEYYYEHNLKNPLLESQARNHTDEQKLQYLSVAGAIYPIPKRRLHLKWHQRSVDVGLGLPFNIASYAMLLHMFAQQTNMVPGTLVGDLTNVHIYDNHLEQIKEQMTRGSLAESPTIKLNKAKNIFSYKFEDFEMLDYIAHPAIMMPVAI